MMTRTLQIVIAALVSGVVMFALIVLFISPAQPAAPFISYLAAAASAVALIVSFVLPSIISTGQRNAIADGKWPAAQFARQSSAGELGDVGPLLAAYQTRQIVHAAILEGAAFFDLMAYLLEKLPLTLVAAGVLLLFIVVGFPTRSRVEDWVENELAAVEQLRQTRTIDAR